MSKPPALVLASPRSRARVGARARRPDPRRRRLAVLRRRRRRHALVGARPDRSQQREPARRGLADPHRRPRRGSAAARPHGVPVHADPGGRPAGASHADGPGAGPRPGDGSRALALRRHREDDGDPRVHRARRRELDRRGGRAGGRLPAPHLRDHRRVAALRDRRRPPAAPAPISDARARWICARASARCGSGSTRSRRPRPWWAIS